MGKKFNYNISQLYEGLITVYAVLEPLTDYVWEITDPHGNKYLQEFTTDAQGIGAIDVSELPDGFVNPFLPGFTVRAKESATACDYVDLIISDSYQAVAVCIENYNQPKNWIGCPPAGVEPVVQLDTPENFTLVGGELSVTATWNAVPDAEGYTIIIASNSSFSANVQTINTAGTSETVTVPPGTWYAKVRATATGKTPSSYTATQSATATAAPVQGRVFYGTKADMGLLTESEIEAGTELAYTPGGDVVVPYNTTEPLIHWAAWPVAETGITGYYVNAFDYGTLSEGGTFAAPVQIGSYLFTQSNYATQIATIEFQQS